VYTLGAWFLLAGCAATYHPEYHPETSYSIVQNFSAPQSVVVGQPSATAPAARPAPSLPPAPVAPPKAATEDDKADKEIIREVLPAAPRRSEARAKCSAGDATSCRLLPGIHINGNVQINGNVTMFGPVYMNDDR
jgi:hypothetical protein